MKVLLAHPGTQHAPRLARELEARGLLTAYWTGLAFAAGSRGARAADFLRRLPGLHGLRSRIIPELPAHRLRTVPGPELHALRRLRRGEESQAVLHERNRQFQERIPEADLRAADDVIGFDTSSWLLAERARVLGRRFWLDRTIAHPAASRPLLEKLGQEFPDWAESVAPRPPAVSAAEAREHELAHRVVVGSGFARDTLLAQGVPASKVRVNPYGVDWQRFAAAPRTRAPDGKIRFLFVGSLIGRKGVPHLLEAWRRLAPAQGELWLAGAGPVERIQARKLPGLRLLGQVPHAEIPALFAAADVFVLPSLLEGFSLTVLEALASGLPVIATPNTGAGEAVEEPALGRLIPPASVEAIETALAHYLSHPPNHEVIRRTAAPLAARFTWHAYGDRWAALLAND